MQGPTDREPPSSDALFVSRAVEATIRIGILAALAVWCFAILRPFVLPVAWASIIAVAVHPVYRRLRASLGGRARLAAVVMLLSGLLLLIVPTAMLGGTLVEGSQALAHLLEKGGFALLAPPEQVRGWPLVGPPLYDYWAQAYGNLGAVFETLRPQIVRIGGRLLAGVAGAGLAFLQSLLAVAIAGVLLANDAVGSRAAYSVARRLAGARGVEFANLAGATVRSVTQGILGVALIQALLAGLGFLALGVPGAGLWALIGLLLCVIQIGLLPVALPIVIYAFVTAEPLTAIVFTIWMTFVSLIDNVLKPLLLGRGLQVPTVVIFLGAIGGFMASGIIGLFVGAVVLVLGHTLLRAWLAEEPETVAQTPEPAAQGSAGRPS